MFIHGNSGINNERSADYTILAFMTTYLRDFGEYQPNVNQIHLPSHTRLSDLYMAYLESQPIEESIRICEKHFVKIFRRIFQNVPVGEPKVVIPKENR